MTALTDERLKAIYIEAMRHGLNCNIGDAAAAALRAVADAAIAADRERRVPDATDLLEFIEEVRRTGDSRLASMAIAVIAAHEAKRAGGPA